MQKYYTAIHNIWFVKYNILGVINSERGELSVWSVEVPPRLEPTSAHSIVLAPKSTTSNFDFVLQPHDHLIDEFRNQ